MKYYKYDDDYGVIENAVTYIEVDNRWVIRQISFNDDTIYASNVSYPHDGLILPDQQVDYDEIDEVTPVSQKEFDLIWNKHLRQRQDIWSKAKAEHQIGRTVQGYIEIFYPQGVIVNLGRGVLGLADYQACQESTPPDLILSSFQKITAVVTGYNEVNQWVNLGSPQVGHECISYDEMNEIRMENKII